MRAHHRGTSANAICPPPFSTAPNSRFNQSSSGQKRCSPLTQAEIALLNKHKGCQKCRRFYISHRGGDCPNNFPERATYFPLSEDMAYDAMRKCAIASTYSRPPDSSAVTRGALVPLPPQLSSSSFSNAYNSYFVPLAIPYSTPAPSVADNTPANIVVH